MLRSKGVLWLPDLWARPAVWTQSQAHLEVSSSNEVWMRWYGAWEEAEWPAAEAERELMLYDFGPCKEYADRRNELVFIGDGFDFKVRTHTKWWLLDGGAPLQGPRRRCSPRYGLHACQGGVNRAGVAKQRRELISHPKSLTFRFATFLRCLPWRSVRVAARLLGRRSWRRSWTPV